MEFSRLFTASLFMHAKENASEASEKHAQVEGGFCADVQFSRNSLHAFNDRIKVRENRGLRAA